MKMALAEAQTFESIPLKVTLNEYIELSKYYSTPKSHGFINGILDKMTVHEGDNAVSLARLRGAADRCHLGLLPSSEAVWEACLLALKPTTGGTLHIHMNVEEERIDAWVDDTVKRFVKWCQHHQLGFTCKPLHVERVKWFAPRVRHVVLDLSLRP